MFVLSILFWYFFFRKPLPIQNHEAFIYKYVHALDIDTADLLSHFEECIEFIDKGRESGGVIVHW